MSTRTKKDRSGTSGKAVWTIGVIIGCVVAVAAIVAVTSSSETTSAPGTTSEFSDVTVIGESLPPLVDSGTTDAAVGMTAPVLTGKGFSGNIVTTTPGTPTLIVLLAHWCPFCQKEVPLLVEWEKSGDMPLGVDVIGIVTATDVAKPNYPPSAWLAREEFPALWPVMVDSQERTAGEAFGVSGYPFFVLLDAKGRVVARTSGAVPINELTTFLQAVATS
ncbi:MAG: TlpA family protein disulfide reductase [Ilumatobacteraceae bacterium]